jgi:hypothetical protein
MRDGGWGCRRLGLPAVGVAGGWGSGRVFADDVMLDMPEVGIEVPLAEVYEGVAFPEEASRA